LVFFELKGALKMLNEKYIYMKRKLLIFVSLVLILFTFSGCLFGHDEEEKINQEVITDTTSKDFYLSGVKVYTNFYNSSGNIIQVNDYDVLGIIIFSTYYSSGIKTKMDIYNSSGIKTHTTFYNSQGVATKQEYYSSGQITHIKYYNSSGNITKTEYYNSSGNITNTVFY
jgi:antitoxin component YwqK of YwqJK toxin-antitoxin module